MAVLQLSGHVAVALMLALANGHDAVADGTGADADPTPLPRWPCAKSPDPSRGLSLLESGLRVGLARLHDRLSKPSSEEIGDNPTVVGVAGGALAELVVNDNATAAEALVDLVFSTQRASDGYVSWLPNGPSGFYDPHGVLLASLQLLPLFGDPELAGRLSPAFLAKVRPKIALAVRASYNQVSGPLTYTNIVVGRCAVPAVLGAWLGNASAVAEGEALLDQWIDYTGRFGIHEYDSTFYFWNDLNALIPAAQFAPTASLRAKFRRVVDFYFAEISASYFADVATMSGPHSRDYAFLDGRFTRVRGVYASGIMGITAAFLDRRSATTPEHLSDLENAVVYHAIKRALAQRRGERFNASSAADAAAAAARTPPLAPMPPVYAPPCAHLALAGLARRVVRSRVSESNVTGDRTLAVMPEAGYAAGSVSEDFAVLLEGPKTPWCNDSKELNIDLAAAPAWDLATDVWPSVTVVVDEHDAPWGLVRGGSWGVPGIANWTKPGHLRGRIGAVQATVGNVTAVLATYDIDARQLSPSPPPPPPSAGARAGARGLSAPLPAARAAAAWTNRTLATNVVLPARVDGGVWLNGSRVDVPAAPSATSTAAGVGAATLGLAHGSTCLAVRFLHADLAAGAQAPAGRAQHGRDDDVSGGGGVPRAAGRRLRAPPSQSDRGDTGGRSDVHVGGDGGGGGKRTARCSGSSAPIEFKTDAAGLEHNAARLAAYHFRPAAGGSAAPKPDDDHVRAAVLFVVGPCEALGRASAADPRGFFSAVARLAAGANATAGKDAHAAGGPAGEASSMLPPRSSSMAAAAEAEAPAAAEPTTTTWWATLDGVVGFPGPFELAVARAADGTVTRRTVSGEGVAMPSAPLVVNGAAVPL